MWIKCHEALVDNRKVRRTSRALDICEAQTIGHLVTLWINTMRHAPTGELDDWDNEDVAHYSGWSGDPGLLVSTLLEFNWLRQDTCLVVNDWGEHNSSELSRIREQNRERQRRYRERHANVTDNVTVTQPEPAKDESDDILAVFEHYRHYHPRAHKKPHSRMREWSKIKARLAEGCTVADLKLAIDGCHRSPFHMGENDNNRKYDSLELIVRDGSKVQSFIELAQQDGPVLAQKTSKTIRAAQSWVEKGAP